MVKVNIYWVVTAWLVIFDILDCIKVRRNETRSRHHESTAQNWSGEVGGRMKLFSSKSKESKHPKTWRRTRVRTARMANRCFVTS
ncbi:hypothetical protein AGABI1DRAFT_116713 [Agaricus bisporus var. burnettii JB137-S8]|uniref:Uncharacterized protein n=1 Tax=Agaricus bisporus var. burnettii (strain JB137-S8 / ATCC MYA-4627 / FGSC 10392) TaxID=597362 RepID=K5WW55_AGABU|nr:uncharacterized protein AGABI1DRAFT_116713 [Agaricus bisporus var. burnettii JB137-S8]EKM74797.1 hypothetical protein AGABI1DRAFT_116713 [Agaricus bisporus var. burnettii JB137-S8]